MFCLLECLCTMWACYPWWLEEKVRVLGTRIIVSCKVQCGHWKSNPGSLTEKLVSLTTELLLQYFIVFLKIQENKYKLYQFKIKSLVTVNRGIQLPECSI